MKRVVLALVVVLGLCVAACGETNARLIPAATVGTSPTPATATATVGATTSVAATAAPTATAISRPVLGSVLSRYTLPDLKLGAVQNSYLPNSITNDRGILLGGTGSDLWHGKGDAANEFWMITDRGPNGTVKVNGEDRNTFVVPEFTPHIIHVRVEGSAITVLKAYPVVGQSGKPVTGLANITSRDGSWYNYNGSTSVPPNINGIDSEGLVHLSDGSFYVVDEYGPSLLKIDATGKVVKRYVPKGVQYTGNDYPVSATLPAIYANRKGNRGFEALTLSSDEKTLYIGLQSPLYVPDKTTGDSSRITRILAWDIVNETTTGEYAYQFEVANSFDPKAKASDMKVSGLAWVNSTTLLVEERTDPIARIYAVDLTKASNIYGGAFDDPTYTPSLESITSTSGNTVNVLPKTLVIDLAALPNTSLKIEGIAIIDATTIAIANDNDFAFGDFDSNGNAITTGVKSIIETVRLNTALPIGVIAPPPTPVVDPASPTAIVPTPTPSMPGLPNTGGRP